MRMATSTLIKSALLSTLLLVGCDNKPDVHPYHPVEQPTKTAVEDDEPICGFACDVAIDSLNDN